MTRDSDSKLLRKNILWNWMKLWTTIWKRGHKRWRIIPTTARHHGLYLRRR
jgi:hypothetical protein